MMPVVNDLGTLKDSWLGLEHGSEAYIFHVRTAGMKAVKCEAFCRTVWAFNEYLSSTQFHNAGVAEC